MDIVTIAALSLIVFSILGLAGFFLYYKSVNEQKSNLKSLMPEYTMDAVPMKGQIKAQTHDPVTGSQIDELEKMTKRIKGKAKKVKVSLETKFFHAGIFSKAEKEKFHHFRKLAMIISIILCVFVIGYYGGSIEFYLIAVVFGILIGIQVPISVLDRKTKNRAEEIMFYLPLVVEQISIGVSSSLDVGPCLDKIVTMAEERDSHNVVTELIKQVYFMVKSGVSLQDALGEVGKLSGHNELKHAFMSLAQVSKHGGEVVKQLQELADAVSGQRETKIEEKIKKLELEATAPVALVFVGFMVILLIGFGLQIQGAFV